ncbi:DNA ligase D [Shouchella lonarensis]|uniref:Bifunctional non-homologous end joining protein LigD n=1 Tax=Shouchella lonarensis TaxID=1464122 RepID=A0A1G6HKU8_9BACI|nr:DNA ligase D [Shouchella lonarensis]SDB94937.1 bifunctional non-homologous end joining protein LigD [Shouchella lonarensis]
MKPMLLTEAIEAPTGKEWMYEAKYDGFRCMFVWEKQPMLIARNGHKLNAMFPEIIDFCHKLHDNVKPFLPLTLDGELVYLSNSKKSEFSMVQRRSKMKDKDVIAAHAASFPCHLILFDVLTYKGQAQVSLDLVIRKQLLSKLFQALNLPVKVDDQDVRRLQAIESRGQYQPLWHTIQAYNGEGIVAKKRTSRWATGVRTKQWLKVKNWRYVTVIITDYDAENGYFGGSVYQQDQLMDIVVFKHGMTDDERKTLVKFIQTNGERKNKIWKLTPCICVDIACIGFDGKLREPRFHSFRFDQLPEACHWRHMQRQLNPLPKDVTMTHPDKPIFPAISQTKNNYLLYLQMIAGYMLPFLQDRLLTVIRYPHGVPGEHFYQKSSPKNVPHFVSTELHDETNFILCNNIETLLWLGNQLALEFHVPFQPIKTEKPTEIVFDLDPPSVNEFHLAIDAALQFKAIFEQFQLTSFVKTSGGKGIQLYIPLPYDTFTYEETGIFTQFVCKFLVEKNRDCFTIERLKKNRGNKLYLDYVQHKGGKTIIAPFSPRGNEKGLIAAPLHWDEVNERLRPEAFTMPTVLDRMYTVGNPFRDFREVGEKQAFNKVLDELKKL